MVSLRLASIILASAFVAAQSVNAAAKPYSPSLYSRASLEDNAVVADNDKMMRRRVVASGGSAPYAPNLFLRSALEGEDDSFTSSSPSSSLVKRAAATSTDTPAIHSAWSIFSRSAAAATAADEEELHARGLIDDEVIEKRGSCHSDSQCSGSQYCSSKKNRCYQQRANNKSCTRDGACKSGYCCESSGVCEQTRNVGSKCHGKDNACDSGYCSVKTSLCHPQASHNGGCRVDSGCKGSLSCVNGTCKNPSPSKPSHPHHPAHPAPSGSAKHRRVLQPTAA